MNSVHSLSFDTVVFAGRENRVRGLRGPGTDVRETDLERRTRVHRQAQVRHVVGHDKSHVDRSRSVFGERDQRDPSKEHTVSVS